jgi:hypothetical protein
MAAGPSDGKPRAGEIENQPTQANAPTSEANALPTAPSSLAGSTTPLVDMTPGEFVRMDARWRGILRGESPLAMGQRVGRRVFSLVPAPQRCKFCNAPFRGSYAGIFNRLGYTPSRKNPRICERCIERAPEGGDQVPLSVLFADVRGYTTLAEQLTSLETTALLHRFYQVASDALLAHDAILGQIAGDEVMAIFVPGLAGSGYPRQAVDAGVSLLRRLGYGSTGRWLNVGIEICTGEEYVGNVGGGGSSPIPRSCHFLSHTLPNMTLLCGSSVE